MDRRPDFALRGPVSRTPEWIYRCERCGERMVETHCKITCPRCGYVRDCSDP